MDAGGRVAAAIGALAEQYGLVEAQRRQLASLLSALERDEQAPTAVRDLKRSLEVHVADSLTAVELHAVRGAGMIADLGSGAGFPGLVLAVALPASEVRLLESQTRKCLFMRKVITEAGIVNAHPVCSRAEDWEEGSGVNDLVLARALAAQPVVLEYAAPLLRLGGSLVDWRGGRKQAEEESSSRAAAELGLQRVEIRRVVPFEGARDHHLHVFEKIGETPERFPRRAGMARKRPLGG
jgi:16S rRNA (guanine527-N7)-methyltransferase